MLSEGRQHSLMLVGPPPVSDEAHNARIQRLSAVFAEVAGSLDVPYIELFSHLVDDPVYRDEVAGHDGAHPRSAGYRRMAALIGSSAKWWFRYP